MKKPVAPSTRNRNINRVLLRVTSGTMVMVMAPEKQEDVIVPIADAIPFLVVNVVDSVVDSVVVVCSCLGLGCDCHFCFCRIDRAARSSALHFF